MGGLDKGICLRFYKRKDIQDEMVKHGRNKEVSVRYTDGFGKRPDVLTYPRDVLELALQNTTSFHASEELWSNPLSLSSDLSRKDLDELRIGWDLVLDIDCPDWEISKLTAYLFIKALKDNQVKDISCKFSVTGDTPVLVKIDHEIKLLSIRTVVDMLKNNQKGEVLSLDKNGYVCFSKITGYLEHKEKVYKIFHKNSQHPLKATKHHSVFVWDHSKIIEKKVEELKDGDHLITFRKTKKIISKTHYFEWDFKFFRKIIKRRIVITKKLMLLLGYYLAEGHLTKTIHQIGFSFNRNESKYINECISLLKEITSKKIFLRHPNKNSTQVLIHSKEWYYFFKKACGRGAKNKHIPSFLWKISKECFEELLLGYLRGDGYKLGEYSITAKSVSHQLIKELVWICQFHGISCSINEEQSKEHILPQGTLFKGSHVYSINIPKSELNNTEFFRKRNKYSPHPRSKLFPIDGLRKVYYQIKPKMFNHHRAEQMTLKKKSANFNRIKKVLDWFDNCKSVEYSSESKEIIKNYRNLFHNDIMTLTINKVTLDKECDVYDLSVDKTERFFGGCYPILLHNSGNKGFHIGVPFEAFPQEVAGKKTKDMFPDYPKKISLYLLDLISNNYIMIKDNKVLFDNKYAFGLNELKNKFGEREFLLTTCLRCKQKIKLSQENTNEFICSRCEQRIKGENEFMKCTKCAILMEKIEQKKTLCPCGSNEYNSVFNPLSIIEVDSILISSRHLYRMPYSLHEKSALVSLPIDPDKVMEFEKEMAHPDKVLTSMFTFLDRNVSGESGRRLLMQALDFEVKLEEEREIEKDYEQFQVESPITEEFFPPCIKKILEGVEDGRKRSVFILMNFLGKIGWSKNEIEVYLQQWNKEKNRESLREVYIKGQMNHFKPGDKLPPNCNNEAYYMDLGMCLPDGLCQKIRNPVNYTIVRWKSHLRDKEK